MCTGECRGLKQVGLIILCCYGVCTQELAKKRHCENNKQTSVNIGCLCKLQQVGMSNWSRSALSSAHLHSSEFSSELPWSACETDWCLASHSLIGLSLFEIPIVLFSETCSYSRNRKIHSEQKVFCVFLFVCFQLWLGVGGGQRGGVVWFVFWFSLIFLVFGLDRRNTLSLNFEFQNSVWFKTDGLSVEVGFSFYYLCFLDQY